MTSKFKLMLSLKDKIEIIKLKEWNHSVKDLCIQFRCGKDQIYDAVKGRNKLIKESESGSSNRKEKCCEKWRLWYNNF